MVRFLAGCACLIVLSTGCTRSKPQGPVHSKASLIIEDSAATPGSQVRFGIQFITENDWHIYWQNPGDSGEPPRVTWQLPPEITANTLEWPTPSRMKTAAGTDYGYKGTTVLLSTFQISPTANPGRKKIAGELRWLACHDICVPQSTHLVVRIRIANATRTNAPSHTLLQSASEQIPRPLPGKFQPSAMILPDSFRLTLTSGDAITSAEFFPADQEQIDNGALQEFQKTGSSVSLVLKKSEYLHQEPQHLRGVIVLNGRDAYQVDAPAHSSATSKGKHLR